MIGGLKDIEEEVESSRVGDDSDVTDADALPSIINGKLHSWSRNPQWRSSFLDQ